MPVVPVALPAYNRRGAPVVSSPVNTGQPQLYGEASRMAATIDPGRLGPSGYTARQVDQRRYIGNGFDARFMADPAHGADVEDNVPSAPGFAAAYRTTRHKDGTLDAVALEPNENGWFDFGGPTPSDYRVVRL